MTTEQTVPVLDEGDSSRFDPDDGRPGSSAGPADDDARVSLAPVRGRGAYDGVWWPRSLRLADELPGLVTVVSTADEPITRVSVNGGTWPDAPARVDHPDAGRLPLRVSWFRTLDAHTITLRGGYRSPVRLLVVPPDTAADQAAELLRGLGHQSVAA